ncbi:inverse autotransporter beta domain-containing protein [Escherichia coli]|uniref:inverse autotransporter beta domain-containing protein n=1 Tax=Escherichia coli TaxID=562 RepID=UPI00039134D8|nr:inverse autotransporter beta domain-containing protein [Escherichia coli]EIG1916909.1 inverse autotransporter beta domain-containing protein [Escherichia coli]EJD2047120.1 inverse autotransporter beta domain-containing protein [Escherichia coli]ELY0379719.1 inverse autotransporter beta domain-containing protein [Escherichia coli]ELZ4782781.1 inverse autotransporter beta domain-containing protein [Escherichia coli]ELZ4786791.1 inverse autotransporter beta domain-containing protein [Escherich
MSHYKTGHKQPRFRYSVLARCVAWANISVQVLFPLAVTFTPVMAARAQHAVQPRLSMGNTTVTADNNVEKNVASFAANAGTFLSSQPDSDATRNFITGMATAKANQEIQEWLGKYGTARVKLNVDKDFSLKDSSLEMLYPIYDTPTNMLFTQGAIHRTDDRTQSNIGFGWRHFSGNDWMAGVNTFIDHDLSRSHTRIGVGAEYWRDYLKLSANGYIRASGWKKSPDIEDYQERPANGWDIRAEGYLPAWPQLGASLMYEQYYGDEVGLFGKDKRQKDPHAISAEVTYTPVPLLTLSAGHKQGKSGENDTRFGLEVYYRIGEPLAKQLDTDSIRERRVLAGSRYDLVERNNNIVLEYRKSEVIRIALPERIEGKGGQTLSLGLVVSKATHGLKNVQWEAPSLLAEGGKITGQGSQWQVTLPAYRPGKDNYYAISAVAYDNKGNASKRVQTEVVITGAGMSADRTALTLDGQSRIQMLANGNEQRPLVLSLRDAEGQPVTGMKDQIKTELAFKPAGNIVTRSLKATKSQAKPTLGEFTETEAGVYQSVFTTGTQSGEATITVSVDGMSKTVTAELRATMMDVANSTLSANEPSGDVVADGQQAYTLTLTAVDSEGNPVTGLKPDAPVFSGAASTGSERPSAGNWTEKGNGVYVATLTLGSAAGQLSVMPRVNGQNAVAQPLVLNVAGDASKAEIRDMTVKVNNQLANGQSANQITLTVVDSYGNPLQGQEVTLTLPQGVTSKTGNTVTTNAAGKVDIELMSTVAGEHSITASVNNAQKTVTVKFKADFSTGQATLEVDGSTPKVANDNDAFTLTATVKDQYGNLLPGAVVVFNLPRGVKPLADGNIMVNADKEGKAELKVVSVTAGTYEITASAGNDQPSNAQSVTFVADKTTATISSIEVIGNRAVADGKTKQTYKVTVTDANNNLLKDSDVTLTASSENLVLDPKGTAKTNEQGQAVFTGSTTIAATYTLTAKVEQANGQVSTKTAESKFVADDKNAVLAASPERVDSLVADGKTTATMTVTLMAGVNPVGGSMWVDIEAPEGVTEKDYQFLPSKADHFSGGKITRTFSTSKPGVYTFTFNALTYGGYEMTPVKVTINAVAAETENGEEEMP